MIIIPSTVEPNESVMQKPLDIGWSRVDHSHNLIFLALKLPVNQEEVREYFDIVEYEFCIVIAHRWRNII